MESSDELTSSERARILRNRNYAIQLKQAQVVNNDYNSTFKFRSASKRLANEGGFIPEDEDDKKFQNYTKRFEKDEEFVDDENGAQSRRKHKHRSFPLLTQTNSTSSQIYSSDQIPIPPDEEKPICYECNRTFEDSFLYENFDALVCDDCRDSKGIHKMITRSTAKERYLLNDVDLDVREPILKYILKRNPHNALWGDMRLYLETQVADRSLEIWGSDEALEEEIERRTKRMEQSKLKSYKKKLNELKLQTRSSLYMKTHKNHVHVFGEEHYDCKTDTYYRICKDCNYKSTFEKL